MANVLLDLSAVLVGVLIYPLALVLVVSLMSPVLWGNIFDAVRGVKRENHL